MDPVVVAISLHAKHVTIKDVVDVRLLAISLDVESPRLANRDDERLSGEDGTQVWVRVICTCTISVLVEVD